MRLSASMTDLKMSPTNDWPQVAATCTRPVIDYGAGAKIRSVAAVGNPDDA